MTIPQGYKQTELGIIPEDWEVTTIKQIADITTGNKNTQDAEEGGKYPFYVRSQNVERINSYSYDCEGIVTAGDGVGTGKIFHYVRGKFGLHQRAYLIYNFKDFDSQYFYCYFSQYFYDRINQMTAKSSVDSVRKEMIEDMCILRAPIAEQRAIASALSDVDGLIAALDKKIAKKRLLKQGAMQQLLTGKKRLHGFTDEWAEKKLGEICSIIMGQSPSSEYYNTQNRGLPLIQGNADLENRQQVVRFYTSQMTKECEKGDVIFSVRAPVGAVGKATHKSCLGRGVCAIKTDNDFLYHYLVYIENDWSSFSKGSTFDSINSDELYQLSLVLPQTKKEQQAIATILSDMDKEIADLEAQRDKYRLLKSGMMQKLLTGQIRFKRE